MGVTLHFSLQLANHKSQRSDFCAVCKANTRHLGIHYCLLNFFMKKEGTTISERVSLLLRLSIYMFSIQQHDLKVILVSYDK